MRSRSPIQSERKHVLTVALEDYFHGPAFRDMISRKVWGRLETRFEHTCLDVLEHLDAHQAKATFFVYPWVGRRCPELVRKVVDRGHEIALAGQRGVSFRFSSPISFRDQLRTDRDIIEQACGKQVLGFRVTDVLLEPRDLWALEVLAEEGFLYDSSLSPFLRKFAGQPWRRFIHTNRFGDRTLWEVPLSSYSLSGLLVPVAGGNYFRQFPEAFVRRALRSLTRKSPLPLVLYFRLWDFDPEQPRIHTGSAWGNFRHYHNSERIVHTLERLLSEYRFTSIANYLNEAQPDVELRPESVLTAATTTVIEMVPARTKTPISVIVPCYNEQAGIPYLSNSLRDLTATLASDYSPEFILVDDGSRDQTWQRLNECFGGRENFKLFRHTVNRGVAAAIRTGLLHAREIACSMDCDCSYDPNDLLPMLGLMHESVDLVTASPYHPDGHVNNVPAWRLFLSRGASRLYRVVTGQKLYTFTSCFRVYRRSVAVTIPLERSGFLGIAELTSKFLLNGRTVVEYPATLEVRMFGQSKMKILKTVCGHINLLLKLSMLRVRREKSQIPAPVSNLETGTVRTISDDVESDLMYPTAINLK